jgi:glutathione S-transferase
MKLYYSPASPFARKAWVTANECGLGGRVTLAATNPHQSTPELVAANPFSKIPALELPNGEVIFESLLICEYLDDMAGGGVVIPVERSQRLAMLRRHALANGLMEVSVLRRVESIRAKDPDRDKNIARQEAITRRALDRLEAVAGTLHETVDLANLTAVIALDYLDFRFPGDAWREGRPALNDWHGRYAKRDSLMTTMPHDLK